MTQDVFRKLHPNDKKWRAPDQKMKYRLDYWLVSNHLLQQSPLVHCCLWSMGKIFIEFRSSCKCLGVTIDSNLSWQEHTKSLSKSFNKKIAVLRRMKFLPSSILQTIYFRTVLLSVLYGILVWGSCSPALMDDVERAHIYELLNLFLNFQGIRMLSN